MSRKSETSTGEMGDRNANISMGNISVHPQSASSIRSKRTLPAPPPRARPSLRGARPSPSRGIQCPEGWHTFRMAAVDFFGKMLDVINTSFNIFKAILTRLLFSLHAIITIWRTEENTQEPLFWLFCLPLYFLLVEGVITIKKRKGLEWKWFCPSVLFYLMSVIPSLWVLEFDIMYKRFKSPDECPMFFPTVAADDNSTVVPTTIQTTHAHTATVTPNTTTSHGPPSLFEVFPLDDSAWVLALHQTMLCILILGRWMLPKPGDVSRDQLSQLLLVYFGIAADILEFQLESVKEDAVKCNEGLIVMVMVFWTWSLIQFTLVLTATKTGQVVEDTKLDRINLHGCCESEVWSILVAMLMQDLPFLVVRLFLMIQYNSVHQMMIFFTAKNILVLMLQTYRWYVLMAERRAERQQLEDQGRRRQEGKSARPWETRRVHNWIDDAC